MEHPPETLRQYLEKIQQQHLLAYWPKLNHSERTVLRNQIESIDLERILAAVNEGRNGVHEFPPESRAAVARAPSGVIRQPSTAADRHQWAEARRIGETELQAGRVAVITVAGGQGTRLGFDLPKGMFPIGPASDRTLFQIFAEQILARQRRHEAGIPWLIMTSDATHTETVRFFERKDYFGLSPDTVRFFRQGSLPAIDAVTGKVLLSGPGELALSPDGHGGLVGALERSGLLDQTGKNGVRHFFYHQVDNPTVVIADPALIGFHAQYQSRLTTSVVCKVSPAERMGVLVDICGRTEVIEYSELTQEQAARRDDSGQWIFWAGNTAVHVFDHSFLQDLSGDGGRLPLHLARKHVSFFHESGLHVRPADPAQPNAFKLERFIFDALPLAGKTLIVEGNREREFNPVKNHSGADSVQTSRDALDRIARQWMRAAGQELPEGPAEISPLTALDEEEYCRKKGSGLFNSP